MITLDLSKAIVKPADKVAEIIEPISRVRLPYKDLVTEVVRYEGRVCLDQTYYKRDADVPVVNGEKAERSIKGRPFRIDLESLGKGQKGAAVALLGAQIQALQAAKDFLEKFDWTSEAEG